MGNKIITIGRQFGSGGHSIAVALSKKLGIPYYDKDLISKIAEKSGYEEEFINKSDQMEAPVKFSLLYRFFAGRDTHGKTIENYIFDAQQKTILELAQKESCIIVGRCGNYILRNHDNLLRVFVYAPLEYRKERILERYGDDARSIEDRIRDKDLRRAANFKIHTDWNWFDMNSYDLCLNSEKFGIEKCIDIIADAAERLD